MKDNGKARYGRFDKFLHWWMAANVVATLVGSYGMSALPEEAKAVEYGNHGLSVTTILIVLAVRVAWRLKEGFPSLPKAMPRIQALLAKAVHYGLYLILCAQVSVGVMLASTTQTEFIAVGYGINFTSLDLVDDRWHDRLLGFHIGLYWTIFAVVALHTAAALKHHFIDRDNVLRRMLPFAMLKPER